MDMLMLFMNLTHKSILARHYTDYGPERIRRIYDKEKHELQKALRIPVARKGQTFKDKTKYSRKKKHKKSFKDYV